MIKCPICKSRFNPKNSVRNIICAPDSSSVVGFATADSEEQKKTYEYIDCPKCGCQAVVQERLCVPEIKITNKEVD